MKPNSADDLAKLVDSNINGKFKKIIFDVSTTKFIDVNTATNFFKAIYGLLKPGGELYVDTNTGPYNRMGFRPDDLDGKIFMSMGYISENQNEADGLVNDNNILFLEKIGFQVERPPELQPYPLPPHKEMELPTSYAKAVKPN